MSPELDIPTQLPERPTDNARTPLTTPFPETAKKDHIYMLPVSLQKCYPLPFFVTMGRTLALASTDLSQPQY